MTDAVKQPYRSRVREEAALRTRRLIRDAATRLFVENGLGATTMRQIAAAAGVADRTVYTAFPTKNALFKEALDVATAGDEEPLSVAQRPDYMAIVEAPDPQTAVRLFAEHGTALLERVGDLLRAAYESAGSDPELRKWIDEARDAMSTNMTSLATQWYQRGLFREGVDIEYAAATLYAVGGAFSHRALRHDLGRSVEQYTEWVAETLMRSLMRDDPL
ncbi:TetR/AcrR family transcriptional regulator [Pseudonocardia sp. TRM90224]|uniref:TetR/AcrR family transcriptional regulator n=1 Tax=Pseudonocardia sp. TRM90224 TaxID=2812678 RepID=UPI001E4B5816|nr:TetR/AcrR family transcriptional regulator [Pseudonocardia sp. TRM90224]